MDTGLFIFYKRNSMSKWYIRDGCWKQETKYQVRGKSYGTMMAYCCSTSNGGKKPLVNVLCCFTVPTC